MNRSTGLSTRVCAGEVEERAYRESGDSTGHVPPELAGVQAALERAACAPAKSRGKPAHLASSFGMANSSMPTPDAHLRPETARRWLAGSVLCAASLAAHATPVADWCDALGARLASVAAASCRARPFLADDVQTPGGRPLVYGDFPARGGERARVLIIGGIHGDELTSVSAVFRWLDWMSDPEAAGFRWRVIPLANPDGLFARPSTRANAHGVDLNRNFETPDWERDAHRYWIDRTRRDPRRYPGRAAGMEIETRWLQRQIAQFRPDLIVSVHAPYNLLDYDGPVPRPLRFGRLSLNRLGVYPGSLGNYGGVYKQIPVVTLELPHATRMPSPRDQQALWRDMLAWMKHNIAAASPPGVAPPEAGAARGGAAIPDR